MRMRKRFTTLVGWLMALSLFSTGFATTLILHPITKTATPPTGSVLPPTVNTYTVGPADFGISWNMDSTTTIVGEKLSYNTVTTATAGSHYSFRNTTLSAELTVDNGVRKDATNYQSDVLVIQVTGADFGTWSNYGFTPPTVASIGLLDDTVFEKVAVTTSGSTMTIKVPIAMIYRLAAAQKGTPTLGSLALRFEFTDAGVTSDNVKSICETSLTFKMSTAYA